MAVWKYKITAFNKEVDAQNLVSVTFKILKDGLEFSINNTVKGHPDHIKNLIEDQVRRKAGAWSKAQTVLNVNDEIEVITI